MISKVKTVKKQLSALKETQKKSDQSYKAAILAVKNVQKLHDLPEEVLLTLDCTLKVIKDCHKKSNENITRFISDSKERIKGIKR